MPSTDEFWEIDGVSLHEYGWSVATFGGSRYDLPPRRGENIQLAKRPGKVPRPKLPDERIINLVMWVNAMDPATGESTGDHTLRFNDSWDFLRRLVWTVEGRQFTLTRRWRLTIDDEPTMLVADAQAELAGTMTPTMTGRHRADFSLELLLADPYFYGPMESKVLDVADPTLVVNRGHDLAAYSNLSIDLIGPLTNPKLTNASPAPDVWVKHTGVIPSGQFVRLDVGGFQAHRHTGGGSTTNVIDTISSSGAQHWFGLNPGSNNVTLTADSGSGTAVINFRPPYV